MAALRESLSMALERNAIPGWRPATFGALRVETPLPGRQCQAMNAQDSTVRNGNPTFRWSSACLSEVGKVRKINEDACLQLAPKGLWVVADGMGGHTAGDLASRLIAESLQQIETPTRLSEFVDAVEDRLIDVNRRLLEIAAQRNLPMTIGSTVVALLAYRCYCVCLWAGDSRAYRYREDRLEQITQDHSRVEELIQLGSLLREDAENHPAAHVITRAVGATDRLFLDMELQALQGGDRYLLCSDGLYRELDDQEIAECMDRDTCEEVCRALVQFTLDRGSRDNVTVVVIQFDKAC